MATQSPTSRPDLPPLADGLPGSAKMLVAMLDREYPAAPPDVGQLHSEQYRLQLAAEQGRRDLIDRLLALQNRQD